MRVIGLDISTKTGWSFFDNGQLVSFGLIEKTKQAFSDYGEYPMNFILVSEDIVDKIMDKVIEIKPDIIVIEEINKTGRFGSRFSQKILDITHGLLIQSLMAEDIANRVRYINTSDWRKHLGLSVIESKKKAKPFLKELEMLKKQFSGCSKTEKKEIKQKIDSIKKDLKSKCIHGKIDKKSISVAHCNLKYGLNFKKGDDDLADAICQAEAFIDGVRFITNKDVFERH